jgi:hypothetical protein
VRGLYGQDEYRKSEDNVSSHSHIRDRSSEFARVGLTKCQLTILDEIRSCGLKGYRDKVGWDSPTLEEVVRDCGDACIYGWL